MFHIEHTTMQAIDLTPLQKRLATLMQKYGPLSPDDCSTWLGQWTVTITPDFRGLEEAGLVEIWIDGDSFESTVYRLTAAGKGVAA
jgi:hypothetical protein